MTGKPPVTLVLASDRVGNHEDASGIEDRTRELRAVGPHEVPIALEEPHERRVSPIDAMEVRMRFVENDGWTLARRIRRSPHGRPIVRIGDLLSPGTRGQADVPRNTHADGRRTTH